MTAYATTDAADAPPRRRPSVASENHAPRMRDPRRRVPCLRFFAELAGSTHPGCVVATLASMHPGCVVLCVRHLSWSFAAEVCGGTSRVHASAIAGARQVRDPQGTSWPTRLTTRMRHDVASVSRHCRPRCRAPRHPGRHGTRHAVSSPCWSRMVPDRNLLSSRALCQVHVPAHAAVLL